MSTAQVFFLFFFKDGSFRQSSVSLGVVSLGIGTSVKIPLPKVPQPKNHTFATGQGAFLVCIGSHFGALVPRVPIEERK